MFIISCFFLTPVNLHKSHYCINDLLSFILSSCYSAEEEDDQVEQRAAVKVEVETQYAQVKTKKRCRHTKPTGGDCLYAKVHKGNLSDC